MSGRLAAIITKIPEWAIGLAMALISVLIVLEVLFRYFLNSPLDWVDEVSRFLLIWLSFLGGAVCVRRGAHITVSLITARLGPRGSAILQAASYALMLWFGCVMAAYGVKATQVAFTQRMVVLGISQGWAYLAVPVAGFLIIIYTLVQVKNLFRPGPHGVKTVDSPGDAGQPIGGDKIARAEGEL